MDWFCKVILLFCFFLTTFNIILTFEWTYTVIVNKYTNKIKCTGSKGIDNSCWFHDSGKNRGLSNAFMLYNNSCYFILNKIKWFESIKKVSAQCSMFGIDAHVNVLRINDLTNILNVENCNILDINYYTILSQYKKKQLISMCKSDDDDNNNNSKKANLINLNYVEIAKLKINIYVVVIYRKEKLFMIFNYGHYNKFIINVNGLIIEKSNNLITQISSNWFLIDTKYIFDLFKFVPESFLLSFQLSNNHNTDTYNILFVYHETKTKSMLPVIVNLKYGIEDHTVQVISKTNNLDNSTGFVNFKLICNETSCKYYNEEMKETTEYISNFTNNLNGSTSKLSTDLSIQVSSTNNFSNNPRIQVLTDSIKQYSYVASFVSLCLIIFIIIIFVIIKITKHHILLHNHAKPFLWIRNRNYNRNNNCNMKIPSHTNLQYIGDLNNKLNNPIQPLIIRSYNNDSDQTDDHLNRLDQIPESRIKIRNCIGFGAFGKVFSGFILNEHGSNELEIAAKELVCSSKDEIGRNRDDLIKELSIMIKAGNYKHIIFPLGICRRENNTDLLIMEYCERGNLKDFLETEVRMIFNRESGFIETSSDNESESLIMLWRFATEIALGMMFLSNKNIIHRDLAARNVLLSNDLVCKISDFGLSRQLPLHKSYYTHVHGAIPLKWMAPEVLLQYKYSTRADVWSYGIILWEIYTFGQVPYENFTMSQMKDLIKNGYRMPVPDICPTIIRNIMQECWNFEANLRPTFNDIVTQLQ